MLKHLQSDDCDCNGHKWLSVSVAMDTAVRPIYFFKAAVWHFERDPFAQTAVKTTRVRYYKTIKISIFNIFDHYNTSPTLRTSDIQLKRGLNTDDTQLHLSIKISESLFLICN